MKKYIIIAIVIILSVILFTIWEAKQPNEEVLSIPDEIYVIIGDETFEDSTHALMEEDIIYLSIDVIKEKIDPNLFYDEIEKTVIFTDKEKVLRYIIEEDKATINHKEFYIDNPIKRVDNIVYIPEDILHSRYDIQINYWEDTNTITVDRLNSNYILGHVIKEGGDIRYSFDRKSPIVLKDIPVETELYIFEEYNDWYKVRTFNGIIGYIEKEYLKMDLVKNIYRTEDKAIGEEYDIGKINLTWDYTYSKMRDISEVKPIVGVNTISPTWFSITSIDGEILDKGNKQYVVEYKKLGYEIWPLIDNSFDPDLTHQFLLSSKAREELINKILGIYDEYGVDGINIDFENVYLKDKDLLTQLVRELYPVFKEKGMTVSIDVTPISVSENWSQCFDRKRLSQTVDYMMLMAYDQHWATSPVAGSVAQYSWVEKSIKGVLEEVPNEKLVLSVPFYTRLWTEEKTDDGEKVSSQALSMDEASRFIEENNVELQWDKESGQYYGQLIQDEKTYKIWIEDSESLRLKSSLINKYDLAGLASWRKGFESEEVWPVISNNIILN